MFLVLQASKTGITPDIVSLDNERDEELGREKLTKKIPESLSDALRTWKFSKLNSLYIAMQRLHIVSTFENIKTIL